MSAGSSLLGTHPDAGRGKIIDDLELLSNLGFADALIPESLHPRVARCPTGSGSGWAGLSAKLWHCDTCVDGGDDLDGTRDRDLLSETVSLYSLPEPPDLLLDFSSDAILNLRFIVSIKLSFVAFFFSSLDEDFPHHEGIIYIKVTEKEWAMPNLRFNT